MRHIHCMIAAAWLALGIAPGLLRAGMVFDAKHNAIRVSDYPEFMPCTPRMLLEADRRMQWGRVSYDEANNRWTVACNLWIGDNDGTDTHFQIGCEGRSAETLVMQGHLVVRPCWIKGQNEGEYCHSSRKRVNRLTLGKPGNPAITASLLFDASPDEHPGLFICALPQTNGSYRIPDAYGGQLHVYHSRISATKQQKDCMAGWESAKRVMGFLFMGESVILDHAVLSWIKGGMTSGMQAQNSRVADAVFEHGGWALVNGQQNAVGCAFRNLEVAVKDDGCLDAALTDCVFADNDRNWSLTHGRGITLVDAVVGEPKQGNVIRAWKNPRTGKTQYPVLASRRHVVIEVVDEGGKPVPAARVVVRCDQDIPEMVDNREHLTDNAGRTPARGNEKAVLMTDVTQQATDEGNPRTTEFTYTIEVTARGFQPAELKGYRPKQSWTVARVDLKKSP